MLPSLWMEMVDEPNVADLRVLEGHRRGADTVRDITTKARGAGSSSI